MSVITRFAPSPTGYLHLGSARTALFNWLYAQHHKGQFLLRIEDTDKIRSSKDFEKRHQDVAFSLLEKGRAYRCYMTQTERTQLRNMSPDQALAHSRLWRDRTDVNPSQPFAIRLKVPLSGETTIQDQLQGNVTVPCNTLDDIVLLRQDGTPTYMLAVVVDDHDMNVSHIIRGDDHLTNALRQKQIYDALDWNMPSLCHIPLIHNDQGEKLSKRKGALDVLEYQKHGILPDALFNALLRLGWSHGNDEKITRDQAISWFDGTHLSKSAARFDEKKLLSLNSYYMRQMDTDQLWDSLTTLAEYINITLDTQHADKAKKILHALAQRCHTLVELAHAAYPYTHLHVSLNDLLSPQQKEKLRTCIPVLHAINPWTGKNIEQALRQHCAIQNIAFKELALPLRLGLTGRRVSPSLTDVMVALGPEWSILRLQNAL